MSERCYSVNILDMIDQIGEETINGIISDFSCPLNKEIETFLTYNAIEFAKKKIFITYLVFDEKSRLVGYYTLTHKTSNIDSTMLSKSSQKKLSRFAKQNEDTGVFDVSAFLIAQLGKNYSVDDGHGISGIDLINHAFVRLLQAQRLVGGGVVFLECENKPKLIDFYSQKKFMVYGERPSDNESIVYKQMMRLF